MKHLKIILLLGVLCFASSSTFAFKKSVSGTLTLGPCTINYSGYVTYTLVPPSINEFHGTITFGGGCNGTINCDVVPIVDGNGNIISLTYQFEQGSDPDAEALIQTEPYNTAMINWFLQEQQNLQN